MKTAHWVLIAVLLAGLGVQSCRLQQTERRAAGYALRADSLEAAGDTTRMVAANVQKMLGDSIIGVERRVIQERQRADALDRSLARERIARAVLVARIDSLRVVTASVTDSTGADSVRRVSFTVDTVPYSGIANVTLPPTAPATLDLWLAIAPIPVHLRLGCGPAVNGIRPATATAFGPAWATLSLDSLSQSPDLCRSPALTRSPRKWPWVALGGAIVAGLGFLLP